MAEQFDLPPQEAIQKSYKLFTQLAAMNTSSGAKVQMRDYLLIERGQELEFLKKRSWQGFWSSLVSKIKRLFGKPDEALQIEKQLKVASNILDVATKADDRLFEQTATTIGERIDGKKLRASVHELGIHLKSLQNHVLHSRAKKAKSIKELQSLKIQLYQGPVSTPQKLSEPVLAELSYLSDILTKDELREVNSSLLFSQYGSLARQGLKEAQIRKDAKQGPADADLDPLRTVLMKALSVVTDKRALLIQQALQKISPKTADVAHDELLLYNFAMIFGDSYLKESGLEGDFSSRPFADLMASFLKTSKVVGNFRDLAAILTNYVNLRDSSLSGKQLRTHIMSKLADFSGNPKRVILFGGWSVHALVYEIEQQKDGKYTFRVYNEGEGIRYHHKQIEVLKDSYETRYELCDIEEQLIFSETFLASLQAFSNMPEDGIGNHTPEEYLITHLLPLLNGKQSKKSSKEAMRYLSPQRSGTCTYRSLLAFVAAYMQPEEYKRFKFHFKLHILDYYLPQLELRASHPITTDGEYKASLRKLSVIKGGIEKFASSTEKLSPYLTKQEIEKQKNSILLYQSKLAAFEEQIIQYEKTLFINQNADLSVKSFSCIPSVASPTIGQLAKEGDLSNAALSNHELSILADIRHLSVDRVEQLLAKICSQKDQLKASSMQHLVECLFKKMGSLHFWEKVTFKDPGSAIPHLTTLMDALSSRVSRKTLHFRARDLSMSFFALYGLETAYKQLPEEARVLKETHVSLLPNSPILGKLCTDDPFCTKILSEIRQITAKRGDEHHLFSPIKLDQNKTEYGKIVPLHRLLTDDIWNWFQAPYNQALREKISQCLIKEKQEQDQEITSTIAMCKSKISMLHAELQSSPSSTRSREIKQEIDKLEAHIGNAPSNIRNGSKYFPPEFLTPQCRLSEHAKASYLFTQKSEFFMDKIQPPDIFPAHFRKFCHYAILANNLLEKSQTGSNFEDFKETLQWDDAYKEVRQFPHKAFETQKDPFENNVYLDQIADAKTKVLYKSLLTERYPEGHIARTLAELEKNHPEISQIESDDAKELFSIHAAKEVQIDALLAYFQEHIDKLSSISWVNIFHSLLFESNLLLEELEHPQKRELLIKRTKSFFTQSIKNSLAIEDIERAANLYWLASTMQRAINFCQQDASPTCTLVEDSLLFEMVEQASDSKHAAHWPVVFEAILASSQEILSSIPETESERKRFGLALLAHVVSRECPTSAQEGALLRYEAAEKARLHLQATLSMPQNVTLDLHAHFMPIFAKIYPQYAGCKILHTKSSITFEKLADSVHLISGKIHHESVDAVDSGSKDCAFRPAPTAVSRFNRHVSQNILRELYRQNLYEKGTDLSHLRCRVLGPIVYILDNKKNIQVAMHEGTLDIFIKKASSPWCYFVPRLNTDQQTNGRANNVHRHVQLINKFHHLREGSSLYLVDPETFEKVYVTKNNLLVPVDPKLQDLVVLTQTPNSLFATFECPSCTIMFARRDEVVRVEMPRLNLSFSKEKRGEKQLWVCNEEKEWWLAEDQFLAHFGPKTGFLLLENSEGMKKAILPVLDPREEKKRSLDFPYEYRFQVDTVSSVRKLSFDLQEAKLIPKTVEGRYYLARIYLEKGFVDKAEELLFDKQAEVSSRSLTDLERYQLMSMAHEPVSKNMGSRTIRCRTRALYLLERNDARNGFEKKQGEKARPEEKEGYIKLLINYISRLGHIMPLDRHDELFLLKRYVDARVDGAMPSETFRLARRLNQLDPAYEVVTDANPNLIKEIQCAKFYFADNEFDASQIIDYNARLRYTASREKNEFPFDPFTVTKAEFESYAPFMLEECLKAQDPTASSLKLLQTVNYLACFGSNAEKPARNLWNKIVSKLKLPTLECHIKYADRQKNKKATPKEAVDFHCLQFIKASDKPEYIAHLGNIFFTKREQPSCTTCVDAEAIFDVNCPEAKDVPIKRQFEKTAADIKFAQTLKEEFHSLKSGANLSFLEHYLQTQHEKEAKLLHLQEEIITTTVALRLSSNPLSKLQFDSKKRRYPNIKELMLLAAKKDVAAYAKSHYPELTEQAISELRSAMKQYLVQKQLADRLLLARLKVEELIKAPKNDPGVISALENQLGRLLSTKRAYDADNDPDAIVFLCLESVLNIVLRPDQVANIRLLASGIKEGRAEVLQMIMGSGKTSVLQPILAFLFAKPSLLSCVMVPEALIEPVKENLEKVLGAAYGQNIVMLPYTRTLAESSEFLTDFYENLIRIKEKGLCLLITPRQKHSIITSLYEAYHLNADRRIGLISKICALLQFEEVTQIDEIDSIMNSKVVFKYPLGAKQVVDVERANLLSELLMQLSEDQELFETVSIDFVKKKMLRVGSNAPSNQVEISKELYLSKVMPKLVEHAKALIERKDPVFQKCLKKGHDTNNYIGHFLAQSSPYDDQIQTQCLPKVEMSILHQLPKNIPALQKIAASSKSELERLIARRQLFRNEMYHWLKSEIPQERERNFLGVLSHAITNILPHSLLKECGVGYGKDPASNKFVAKPYEAAGSPKPTIFSDVYEQVIYSTQLLLYYGVTKEGSRSYLLDLQRKAQLETLQTGCLISDTESYQKFKSIMKERAPQVSFLESPLSDTLLEEFQLKLTSNRESLLGFMQSHVYNQIALYTKNVSSTPQTLAGSSKLSVGYTGTQDEGILARNMVAHAELGTDGKTINAVEGKNPRVTLYKETQQKKLSQQLIDSLLHDDNYDVFIDSGGWLKEEKIDLYAECLLKACNESSKRKGVKSIVYHNVHGAIISLERDSGGHLCHVPIGESRYKTTDGVSITLIQQKYETGTNILQKPTAKALMSVRKGMTLRDDLQSNFRMRQILYNQRIDFAITPEVQNHVAALVLDGLFANDQFRKVVNELPGFTSEKLAHLNLEPDLKIALEKALLDLKGQKDLVAKFAKGLIQPRIFQIELLQSLSKHFMVTSKRLWRYLGVNLSVAQQDKHWHAGRQRMREVIEKPLRLALIDRTLPLQARKEFFQSMQSLVIQTTEDAPFNHMVIGNQFLEASRAIEREMNIILEYRKQILKAAPIIQEKIKAFAPELFDDAQIQSILHSCIDIEGISDVVQSPESMIGHELEQEQESEEEAENEVEVQQLDGLPRNDKYENLTTYSDATGYDISRLFHANLFEINSILPRGVSLSESQKLLISPNLFRLPMKLGSSDAGLYHLPGRFLFVMEEKNAPRRYVLVSHEDAARIKKGLYNHSLTHGKAMRLYALDGTLIASSNPKKSEDPNLPLMFMQAKLVTGRVNFTKEEMKLLQTLLSKQQDPKVLKKLFEDIIKYKPATAKRFFGTSLEKLIRERHHFKIQQQTWNSHTHGGQD